MAKSTYGTGGLDFDKKKRSWPNEINIFIALLVIIAIFEALGQTLPYMNDQSFLFDSRGRFESIFNEARLRIIILQGYTSHHIRRHRFVIRTASGCDGHDCHVVCTN